MSTNKNTALTPPDELVAFLKKSRAELSRLTGQSYAFIKVECGEGDRIVWGTYVDGGAHTTGATLEENFATQLVEMGPAARAKRTRERAEQLLKEAALLEREAEMAPRVGP